MGNEAISVEVVYALPFEADATLLQLPAEATLEMAIAASGVLGRHPEIDPMTCRYGVWGRRAKPTEPLRDGDRVEIYRPLRADPKEVRRRRAKQRLSKR